MNINIDFDLLYQRLETYAFEPQQHENDNFPNIFSELMLDRPVPFLKFLQKELTTATFYNMFYLIFLIFIIPSQFSTYWQCSVLTTVNLIIICAINIFVLPFKYMILTRLWKIQSTIHMEPPNATSGKVICFFYSRILNTNAKISKLLMVAYISCFYTFSVHVDKADPHCEEGFDLYYVGIILTLGFLVKLFVTYVRFKNLYFKNYLGYGRLSEFELNKMKVDTLNESEKIEEMRQKEEKCVICWDEYILNDQIRTLSCGGKHFFHRNCIDEWLSKYSKCPVCSHVFFFENE